MRKLGYSLVSVLIVTTFHAQAETTSITGRFQGTGRACYGTLDIRPKTISWTTSFSQCKPTAYKLLGKSKQRNLIEQIYLLSNNTKACRYPVIRLTHTGPSEDTGWEITGYSSEKIYHIDKSNDYKKKSADTLSCYLFRELDK